MQGAHRNKARAMNKSCDPENKKKLRPVESNKTLTFHQIDDLKNRVLVNPSPITVDANDQNVSFIDGTVTIDQPIPFV